MARLNTATPRPAATSFITTEPVATSHTALGAPGYLRDARSELYLLGVSFFAGEQVYHEKITTRTSRFTDLIRHLAVEDPQWTADFLRYLRGTMNIRTAALMGAVEFVRARNAASAETSHTTGDHGLGRRVVDSVLLRADEPMEILAYHSQHYGRQIPQAIRKGIGDAVRRLWTERAFLKWDSPARDWRMADVLSLVHASPREEWQSAVFKAASDRRYRNTDLLPPGVPVLRYRRELMSMPVPERRPWLLRAQREGRAPELLRAAGMTWESLAGWLQSPMDAEAWEAIIPGMNLGALVRNLRNFDEAHVSDTIAATVAAKLADPAEIKASRLLPFRFLAAYQATPSLRWSGPLETALNLSVANLPSLTDRTLILVDRSGSMWGQKMSEHSTMSWADGAAIFGAALALRAEKADLIQFGDTHEPVPFRSAESVLRVVDRFRSLGGTRTASALRAHYRPGQHDRVVIITDEQAEPDTLYEGWGNPVPLDTFVGPNTPVYTWNFGGYRTAQMRSGSANRHCMGGLTDGGFQVIPLLEAGARARWPWMSTDA